MEDNVKSLENQMEDLERNEKTLDNKIEKKKQELERQEKRLTTLQSVRPAYMDEFERMQGELNEMYQVGVPQHAWVVGVRRGWGGAQRGQCGESTGSLQRNIHVIYSLHARICTCPPRGAACRGSACMHGAPV